MARWFLALTSVAVICAVPLCATAQETAEAERVLTWETLPPLPDPIGYAGVYAGVSNGALIVAGGANFPTAPPWDDGQKVWHDSIFVLTQEDGQWQRVGRLPRPLAYGVSLTVEGGVLCIGGGDANRHYADVFLLSWTGDAIELVELASLPKPVAFMCGAMLDDSTICVAGGRAQPDSPNTLNTFWTLDLSESEPQWEDLEPWPGRPRMLAVAGVQDGAFILLSGVDLVPDDDGQPKREYLRDGYKYQPREGWKHTADIPNPVAAAPTPAVPYGQSHLLILGGDSGVDADKDLREAHPGFSTDILAYHTITNTWIRTGVLPKNPEQGVWPPVTTVTTEWNGRIIVPSGEARPGIRTPQMLAGKLFVRKSGFKRLDYVALVLYLGAMVCIGFYFLGREKSTEDFFLGGRRVPWWAAGLSIFGTQLSAITYMSFPAKTYATDWAYFLNNMGTLVIAPLVIWLYLPFFRRLNVTTAYEYLERRFNVGVRMVGSAVYILLQLGRMGFVLFLPAMALSAVTGLSVHVSILLMGVLATLYTVLGGIEAVIWTDVLQVVVLAGGAIVALVTVVFDAGGLGEVISIAQGDAKLRAFILSWDLTGPTTFVIVLSVVGGLVGSTSNQSVVQRYLTTRSEKEAAQAIWANAVLSVLATLIFFALGTALFAFYKTHPDRLNPALQTDAVFPWFIAEQLPAGVSGIVIAGLFAAAMSSLDSCMNSVATVVTTDFLKRLVPNVSDRRWLKVARLLTLVLGVIGSVTALLLATYDIRSIWDQYIKIMALFSGGLAGLFALGIFTRRAHGTGALIGVPASVLALYLVQRHTALHFFLWSTVGIVTCFVVGYLCSLWIPAEKRPLDGLTLHSTIRFPGNRQTRTD